MNQQVELGVRNRNPDVLTSIANLSNDEVFTPPEFANRMLDTLAEAWAESNSGAVIWEDPTVTFLDPFTKSGVFLREITKRLVDGLEKQIPDLQTRVDHVLANQVFGIAITELTALLARRSVYCSKQADGKYSIAKVFDSELGNIWFERGQHSWAGSRCRFCGATKTQLDRGDTAETYAYPFIHTDDAAALLAKHFGADVKFDVIIGNPPYQLDDGGHGASAMPIYQKFVDQAMALEPRALSMVIPSRWFAGGRGLDSFRSKMLTNRHIKKLVDYPDSRECFPGVDVAGGVCYFLMDDSFDGDCDVISFHDVSAPSSSKRSLDEWGSDVFIRFNEANSILHKVLDLEAGHGATELSDSGSFKSIVSSQKPFGLRTFFRGAAERTSAKNVRILQSGGQGWASDSEITAGREMLHKWKVFTSKSSSEHAGQADAMGRRKVLSLTGVLEPNAAVTETYVVIGAFETEEQARNCLSYVTTKFFRFLIAIRSSSQDISRNAYSFVPLLDFTRSWSDEALCNRYGLSTAEIAFIESMIRPMEVEVAE